MSVLRALVLATALVCSAFGGRAAAQCGGAQLCAPGANPCVVTGACALMSGTTFDLGGRDLTFAAGARVSIPGSGSGVTRIINAHDVVFESDARIEAAPIELDGNGSSYRRGQTIEITSTGRIEMKGTPKAALIDVAGSHEGGQIDLDAGTDLTMNGKLDASASNGAGYGGQIGLVARTGAITIGGAGLDADGGNTINDEVDSSGGLITVLAATDLTVAGPIATSGGDCGFCAVTLLAQGGNLVTTALGTIEARATGAYGGGAEIDIESGGSTAIGGGIVASGRGSAGEFEGGYGGLVSIITGADLSVAGPVDLRAHQAANIPEGTGGELSIDTAGQVRIGGTVTLTGPGPDSVGGRLTVDAGTLIEVSGVLDASSTTFGGSIDLRAMGTLDVTPTGQLRVYGGDSALDGAGTTALAACIVKLRSTSPTVRSVVRNGGYAPDPDMPFGINLLRVGQSCELSGQLLAPTGENRVIRRSGVPKCSVANVDAFDVQPPADFGTIDPLLDLPCCGTSCEGTTTTTEPPATTTTTTEPPPSTTTTTLPGSTTTTTLVEPTTTTTTTQPQTSTTTTTTSEPSSTTTTSAPGSTTTTTAAPVSTTTTTTLAPDPCDAPATDYDAVQCGLGALDEVLAANSADDLGGSRLVAKLGKLLDRAEAALAQSTTVKNPKAKLRRARAQLRAFERAVRKAAKKEKLRSDLGAALLDLTSNTGGALDVLRSSSS